MQQDKPKIQDKRCQLCDRHASIRTPWTLGNVSAGTWLCDRCYWDALAEWEEQRYGRGQ